MSSSSSPEEPRVDRMRALVARLRSVEGAAFGIACVAFFLRAFHRAPVWSSSDAADLPFTIDRVACRSDGVLSHLRTLALYRLGGVESVLVYLYVRAASLLHLHVTETTWIALALVVGTANVYLAFLLVRELAGAAAGLLGAVLVAVCSLDIIQSRHLGAPWQYEEFCQIALTYLLLKLPGATSPKTKRLFHVVLAVYFWTGNQMLGILPVLAYGALSLVFERNREERVLSFLRRCFVGWTLLVPVLSMGVLLYVTFVLRTGHLFHALYQKRHVLGFYVPHWFDDIHSDIGPGATWFGLAAVLAATVSERRLLSTKRLPVVLFACYAGPFWFLIPPGGTLTRGYITYGVTALLLCLPLGMVFAGARRAVQIAFPAVAALMLFGSAFQSAYHLVSSPLIAAQGFQGSYTPNNGVKTAAAWVRNRPGNGRVFSDAWGGGGIEPPNVWMYFRRPAFALSDAGTATMPYETFRGSASAMDYLLVLPANRRLVTRYFGSTFKESLRVKDGDRGEVLLVYTRDKAGAPEVLDVREGDREFERKYSLYCSE